jgi:MATE family multidrug resistance protein
MIVYKTKCVLVFDIGTKGVAVGAGWQGIVAYVNIGCYYLCGIPIGLVLGYKMELGVKVSKISKSNLNKELAYMISFKLI